VVEARTAGTRKFELLPVETGFGLTRLPEPSDGDVFLDFEGDPFVGEHGLEYLVKRHPELGSVYPVARQRYRSRCDPAGRRQLGIARTSAIHLAERRAP
jgi:predicted RecB family nuclease